MTTAPSSGRRANTNGRAAEQTLFDMLAGRGYRVRRQAPVGVGAFGSGLHADLLVHGIPAYPSGLVIESKWQDVAGTADEKLAMLWVNIAEERYPCPVLIVCHGGGQRAGAIRWLKSKVDHDRLVAVLSLEEFLSWCNRSL